MTASALGPWPAYTEEEVEAVAETLRSNRVNYWTGDRCRQFETEFAAWTQAKHAIAVTNGTVALDLGLHGLRIGSANGGHATDEVIVTPRTFIASVSTVINAGAVPVFADVELESGNLSAATIAPLISDRTCGIIVVHLAGWPVDMDPIMELAASRGIHVVEDCAQAHGALYKGRPVGSIGHVGCWSFCQDKIMTTGGEGGMVTTDDPDLWSRMWSFKDHGKSWEAVYGRAHEPGFRWLHERFGTNWRMIEMQAAIGLIQLRRMQEWTQARRHRARVLLDALKPFIGKEGLLDVPIPDERKGTRHAYYRLYGYLYRENLPQGWDRDRIVEAFADRGLPCFQGTCSEVYREKAFEGTGMRPPTRLPNARRLGETSLAWLVHPTITEEQLDRAASTIAELFSTISDRS